MLLRVCTLIITKILFNNSSLISNKYLIYEGIPEPNITWTKDDEMISRTMGNVQKRKWAIILEDLTPKDNGRYKCRICNIYGCIEHTTRLDVKGKAHVTYVFLPIGIKMTRIE